MSSAIRLPFSTQGFSTSRTPASRPKHNGLPADAPSTHAVHSRRAPSRVRSLPIRVSVSMQARLIINADDFGLTRGVNRAIAELHDAGAVTSATLMATGPAFDDAVTLARAQPSLG